MPSRASRRNLNSSLDSRPPLEIEEGKLAFSVQIPSVPAKLATLRRKTPKVARCRFKVISSIDIAFNMASKQNLPDETTLIDLLYKLRKRL